jgi:PTS system beta-glucosides-specific IIC component
MVISFVAVMATYKDDEPGSKAENKTTEGGAARTIVSPIKGNAMDLSEAKDEAFASGALGQGVAIEPTEGKLYAPFDGTIETFFPTGHALGLKSADGVELLVHIGMDTVDMNGDGFSPKAKQGDTVKKGDLLLEFDIDKIKAAGHSVISPVVVTNSDDFADVIPEANGAVGAGDTIITVL